MKAAPAPLEVKPMADLFKALGDETRLRIVALLSHGELCVCHLESALAISQPNASRQMAILRAAGLVEARREGSWIHYRLAAQAHPDRKRQLDAIVRSFTSRELLRKDVERLVATRGPKSCK